MTATPKPAPDPQLPPQTAEQPDHRRNRRRKMIINRPFQLRMLRPLFIGYAVMLASTVFFVLMPVHLALERETDPVIQAVLQSQLVTLELRLLPWVLLSFFIAAPLVVLNSNRVAGLMSRLRRELLGLSEGRRPEVHFRAADEFRELEPALADVAKKIQHLGERPAQLLRPLRHNVSALSGKAAELSSDQIVATLNKIVAEMDASIERPAAKGGKQ